MIKLLRQVDDNWYEGENNNEIGILPVSYIEVSTINQLILANVPILYPLKTKAFVFLVFSVGIKWEHWPEMG